MELRKPHALPAGGTIGIAAPGGPIDAERLEGGCALWREAGFRVFHRDDVTARHGYLAGDDARRIAELRQLVADPEVDAIVCARGGYGCDRILDQLDPEPFREARKALVGYSDITALLIWQERRAGLTGFHGPMLEYGGDLDPTAHRLLIDQLTGAAEPPTVLAGRGRGGGSREGRLLGGNLMLVAASIGTSWEIDLDGAILLVEEVHEKPYRIDRLLQQLRGAGKLERLAGIGVGELGTCCDPRYPEPTAVAVIEQIAAPRGVPLVTELPFGHVRRSHAWPFGARATIDGDAGEVRIVESGVEAP